MCFQFASRPAAAMPADRSLQLTLLSDIFFSNNSKAKLAPSDEGKILAHEFRSRIRELLVIIFMIQIIF